MFVNNFTSSTLLLGDSGNSKKSPQKKGNAMNSQKKHHTSTKKGPKEHTSAPTSATTNDNFSNNDVTEVCHQRTNLDAVPELDLSVNSGEGCENDKILTDKIPKVD